MTRDLFFSQDFSTDLLAGRADLLPFVHAGLVVVHRLELVRLFRQAAALLRPLAPTAAPYSSMTAPVPSSW